MLSRVALPVLVVALVAGCSAGGAADDPAATATASPSSSSPVDPSAEPPSSEPAAPEVAPATGEPITVTAVEGDLYRFRAPDGWRLSTVGPSAELVTVDGTMSVSGQDTPAFDGETLDAVADVVVSGLRRRGVEVTREDDRVIDGVEAAVVSGSSRRGYYYEVTGLYSESVFNLVFELPEDTPEARETIESVLASVEWL